MMRAIRVLFLGVLAVALITVAMANRGPLSVRLLPAEVSRLVGFDWEITLPTFVVLFAAGVIGLALGFLWEWLREHKHRARAASERRERQRLEQEFSKAGNSSASHDEVIEILEGR